MISKILWIISIVSSIIAALFIVIVVTQSESSPQVASGAAVGLAIAIIPYCISRASSEIRAINKDNLKSKEEE